MGSPCLFTRQRVLKMGYFCWLRVKNPNHLQTAELSLGYFEDAKFYLESKVSFNDISSIVIYAVLYCLVVGILRFFGQFHG